MTTDRHPLLTETGRRVLENLLEATDSPRWNHRCGDRLDAAALARVQRFAATILADPPRWAAGTAPSWITGFAEHVRRVVPLHQATSGAGVHGADGQTSSRDDLDRAWWELVPDDADLDDLIWFPTSGTGRRPVVVPTHPVTVSCYYPLLLEAARWHGVSVRFRSDRADWCTVVSQEHGGFTVPSWSSVLGSATAQVNLHDAAWRASGDRRRFLERHDPQVITGDPLSLGHLADLDLALRPAVVISTALHLAPATQHRLSARFGCPVVDVYSTTESGPIAAARPGGGMRLLQPRLFVEIVDEAGLPCPPGAVGTVTLTGGMNPYLPLLRYRTGDTARLTWTGDQPVLEQLGGRPLVTLRTASGTAVSSFDVTQVLEPLALRRWSVHQRLDTSVIVAVDPERGAPADVDAQIAALIERVLGPVAVEIVPLTAPDKVLPFTLEIQA